MWEIPNLERYRREPRIDELYRKVKARYAEVSLPAHGWDHISRTVANAVAIGEAEGANMETVIAAMLLHDIGFLSDPDPANHHERGARMSYDWTGSWSIAVRNEIAACITGHKGEAEGFETSPTNLEQKVVCDADMLEKVGYIGVLQGARALAEFGATCLPKYRSLLEIALTLGHSPKAVFYTESGRNIAESRGGLEPRSEVFSRVEEELREYYR